MAYVSTSFSLLEEEFERLRKEAFEQKTSHSEIIRTALSRHWKTIDEIRGFGKPRYRLLTRQFHVDVVMYDESLECPYGHSVAERCYPAIRVENRFLEDPEYFLMLVSEMGEWEYYERNPMVNEIISRYGGQDVIRENFLSLRPKITKAKDLVGWRYHPANLRDVDLGSNYPVVDEDGVIRRIVSAEDATPDLVIVNDAFLAASEDAERLAKELLGAMKK